MKIGLTLPNAGVNATPEKIAAIAQNAERLGFHSVWVTDHVVLPERVESSYPYRPDGRWNFPTDTNWLDPLLTLSLAGSAGPSLQLGTSVMVVPLRHPLLLAKQLSTLDYLTKGRVILGAGAGWMREEFELIVGDGFEDRGKRVIEMVKLMRACWSGEEINFTGKFFQVKESKMYPRPAQGQIPIIWGGHSDPALKRVARIGDGWHPTQIPREQLEQGLAKLRTFCEEFGRDFTSVMVVNRPGGKLDAESHAQYVGLGVNHHVCDIPSKEPGLQDLFEEMHRVAEVCKLTPRAQLTGPS